MQSGRRSAFAWFGARGAAMGLSCLWVFVATVLAVNVCLGAEPLTSKDDGATIRKQVGAVIAEQLRSAGLMARPQSQNELDRLTKTHVPRLAATFAARLNAQSQRRLSAAGPDGQQALASAVDNWMLNQMGLALLHLSTEEKARWALAMFDLRPAPKGQSCLEGVQGQPPEVDAQGLEFRAAAMEALFSRMGNFTSAPARVPEPSASAFLWSWVVDTVYPKVEAPPSLMRALTDYDEYACEVGKWSLRRAARAPDRFAYELDDIFVSVVEQLAATTEAWLRADPAWADRVLPARTTPEGYPPAAAFFKVTGETVVEFTLAADGRPRDAVVLSRHVEVPGVYGEAPKAFEHLFDDAAIELAMARRYPHAAAGNLRRDRRVRLPIGWKLDH
jgi:hypothetical protein